MQTASADAPDGSGIAIRLRGLCKSFGTVTAVAGVDLDIRDGEFLTLLGPSGSGKTTVLRLIAGFERPDAGSIELGGVNITDAPPYERDVNTVFQDYALFPHMTVQENVEYGMRVRKVGKEERRARAADALEQVQLRGMGSRKPSQLSGGQRQRVALARALVNRPRVLLLDEPLGALDLKLRRQMQAELKGIQSQVGITFIFVTHDQEEALSMSDRIAVFDSGRIVQLGTPTQIYTQPGDQFVAGFVGTSNVFDPVAALSVLGRSGTVSIRPEHIRISEGPLGAEFTSAAGVVASASYAGSSTDVAVALDAGLSITVTVPNASSNATLPTAGTRVWCSWRKEDEFVIAPR